MTRTAELIYNHLAKEEINRNISEEKTEELFIDSEKLKKHKTDTVERLKIKLKTGKCSEFLLEQLAIHRGDYGEKFGNKIEYYNTSEILDLVECIEKNQLSGMSFRGDILKDYLHIHHSPFACLGYSIVRNVKEYWYKNKKIRNEKIQEFESIVTKCGRDNISTIAITLHQKAISKKELKGEWLIYKKHSGKNYYLCLASHREGNNRIESDTNIFDNKISKCLAEFPELK